MMIVKKVSADQPKKVTALFALLIFTPLPTLGVVFAAFGDAGVIGRLIWIIAKVGLFIGPVLYWRFVQGQMIKFPRMDLSGVLAGMVSAALLGSVIFCAFWFIAKPGIDPEPLSVLVTSFGLTTPAKYLLLALYLTVVNSLIEEYVFRWFFYQQLSQLVNPIMAVFCSALIFTVHHTVVLSAYVPWYFNLLASLGVFSGGLIWSFLYYRYSQIWPSYISHIGADIGVFAIGFYMIFS